MLPSDLRLKRKRDFEILFTEGKFLADPMLTMKYWLVEPGKYPKRGFAGSDLKINFIVSAKVGKTAVVRNRAKRQMREVVRLLLKEGKIKSGFFIAFVAKNSLIGADYTKIEASIHGLLRRAHLLV